MQVLLGSIPGDNAQVEIARHITTLPFEDGRTGVALAALWASWTRCPCSNAFPSGHNKSCTTCWEGQRLGVWVRSKEEIPTTTSSIRSGALASGNVVGSTTRLPQTNTISGDGSAFPVVCRRPDASEVAFGSVCKSGVVWICNRVRSETAHLLYHRVGCATR